MKPGANTQTTAVALRQSLCIAAYVLLVESSHPPFEDCPRHMLDNSCGSGCGSGCGSAIRQCETTQDSTFCCVLSPSYAAAPASSPSGAGTVKTIKVNLGALYANWVVLLEWAPIGTGLYQVVTRIKLDSLGAIVTKAKVPNGSVLRIQAGGKTIASFGLPGV